MRLSILCILILLTSFSFGQKYDSVFLPVNKFVNGGVATCSPPQINQAEINSLIARASFVRLQDYATPNDNTNDLTGLTNALNAMIALPGHVKGINMGSFTSSGGTYILGTPNSYMQRWEKTFNLPSTDTFLMIGTNVWLKAADLSRNTFLDFECAGTQKTFVLWQGINIDGNQTFQRWPHNPRGGVYDSYDPNCGPDYKACQDKWWLEHARFVGVVNAGTFIVNNVKTINTVMDGFVGELCYIYHVNNSTATGGAPFFFGQWPDTPHAAFEQGTYYKARIESDPTHSYFTHVSCFGGSIALHVSSATVRQGFLSSQSTAFFQYDTIVNQAQDGIHIEDCWRVVSMNLYMGRDVNPPNGQIYQERFHVSNQTRTAAFYQNNFLNSRLNLNQGSSLNMATVRNCQFISKLVDTRYLQHFFYCSGNAPGGSSSVTNSYFNGKVGAQQVMADYIRRCEFLNRQGANGIESAIATDSVHFDNGSSGAVNTGAARYFNTYDASALSNQNPTGNWQSVFYNRVRVFKVDMDNKNKMYNIANL